MSRTVSRPPAAMTAHNGMTAAEKWDAGLDLEFDEGEFDDMEEEDESLYDADEKRGKDDIEYVAGPNENGTGNGMRRKTSSRADRRGKGPMQARSNSRAQALSIKEFLDDKRSFSSDLSLSATPSNSSSSSSPTPSTENIRPHPTQTYPTPPRLASMEVSMPAVPAPTAAPRSSMTHSRTHSHGAPAIHVTLSADRVSLSDDEVSPQTPAPTS